MMNTKDDRRDNSTLSIVSSTITAISHCIIFLRFVGNHGYVSLFPLMLKIIDAKSEKLGAVLNSLRNPKVIIIVAGQNHMLFSGISKNAHYLQNIFPSLEFHQFLCSVLVIWTSTLVTIDHVIQLYIIAIHYTVAMDTIWIKVIG